MIYFILNDVLSKSILHYANMVVSDFSIVLFFLGTPKKVTDYYEVSLTDRQSDRLLPKVGFI